MIASGGADPDGIRVLMHYRIFETWRLMAALSIMMWHFMRFAPEGHEAASAFFYRLLPMMEMFFMISGFLIMERYGDTLLMERGSFRHYLIRRLARFYPLYLLTLLFFCAVGFALHMGWVHSDSPGRYAWSALPANLLLVHAWGLTDQLTFNYVSWSLSAEWFCYLALPVIVLAYRGRGKLGLLAVALAAIVALEAAVAWRVIPFDSWLEANTWGAYRAFADFALGALVAIAVRDSRLKLTTHWPAWLLFAVSILAMATQQAPYVIVGLLAVAMYFAAVVERNDQRNSAYLVWLHPVGKVSLGIYLLHPVIEAIFLSVLWRKLIEPLGVTSFYVYWLLPAAVVIVVSIFSERYFERPVGKLLVEKFARSPSRRPAALAPAE
jgi:peptidoglycan/LPS O-acetylase OafA/YrhL